MPTPLVKTTNFADTSLSCSFQSCIYICCFRSWTFFSYVPGGHPTVRKCCCFFLASITPNKPIHMSFFISGGGWSCLRTWSKQQISLIRQFQDWSEVVHIWCFAPCTVFNYVPGWHPIHQKTFFWGGFSQLLLLTTPFILFIYFWGGGWSCLRHWSKPLISQIHYFQIRFEVIPIFVVLDRTRFLAMC